MELLKIASNKSIKSLKGANLNIPPVCRSGEQFSR